MRAALGRDASAQKAKYKILQVAQKTGGRDEGSPEQN